MLASLCHRLRYHCQFWKLFFFFLLVKIFFPEGISNRKGDCHPCRITSAVQMSVMKISVRQLDRSWCYKQTLPCGYAWYAGLNVKCNFGATAPSGTWHPPDGPSVLCLHLHPTDCKSVINIQLPLMFLVHVSTCARSGTYMQMHTSTANSVKRCACVELKYNIVN
jgi:hypothetical protein